MPSFWVGFPNDLFPFGCPADFKRLTVVFFALFGGFLPACQVRELDVSGASGDGVGGSGSGAVEEESGGSFSSLGGEESEEGGGHAGVEPDEDDVGGQSNDEDDDGDQSNDDEGDRSDDDEQESSDWGSAALGDNCFPIGSKDGEDRPRENLICAKPWECQAVGDEDVFRCVKAIVIEGRLLDDLSGEGIENGEIQAFDHMRRPLGMMAESGEDGTYELHLEFPRGVDGELEAKGTGILLRASADGYSPFPAGLRAAILIDLDANLREEEERFVLRDPRNAISLAPSEDDSDGTIIGTVMDQGRPVQATLVTARPLRTNEAAKWGVADKWGHFHLYNLNPGLYQVRAYRGGHSFAPTAIIVEADRTQVLDIYGSDQTTSVVEGEIDIVDAPRDAATSVVLIPSEVFDQGMKSGPVPLGFRAPQSDEEEWITDDFRLTGIPRGNYKVLAAFEKDSLVRDPDLSISGTDIIDLEIGEGDDEVFLQKRPKVTGAIEIVSPGGEGEDRVEGEFSFVFEDDRGEDRYELRLMDSSGQLVWEDTEVQRSWRREIEVVYDGPALEAGSVYRFQVSSWKDRNGDSFILSHSEESSGIFRYEPEDHSP